MRVNTSHEIRGARYTSYISIPESTVESLTGVLKHVAWVAGRAAPEVEILDESNVQES